MTYILFFFLQLLGYLEFQIFLLILQIATKDILTLDLISPKTLGISLWRFALNNKVVALKLNRGGFRGERGGHASPLFCNHLLFSDYFEELQPVLVKVKLIINNAPLTYIYPNTMEIYLTPSHLLFGRQLLYDCSTKLTLVRNVTVLPITADKTNRISNHFWHRWRHGYVVNLREIQRASKLNMNSQKIMLC